MGTCQACGEGLYRKGTPVPATNRNRGWRGALQRPARLPKVTFFHSPGPPLQWAGAFCYLASDASNSTTARAISETMTKRLMAVLLFRLAPRRAQAVSEKKQPCSSSYSLLFPSTQCARKYGYRTSAQTKRKHPLGLSDSLPPLFRFAALIVYFIDLFHFSRKLEKYINWPLPGLISPCYTRFNPF